MKSENPYKCVKIGDLLTWHESGIRDEKPRPALCVNINAKRSLDLVVISDHAVGLKVGVLFMDQAPAKNEDITHTGRWDFGAAQVRLWEAEERIERLEKGLADTSAKLQEILNLAQAEV